MFEPKRKPAMSLADVVSNQHPLPAAQEQQFQQAMYFQPGWRDWYRDFENARGRPPNIEPGGDYNYRLAWLNGADPQFHPESGTYHGTSEATVPPMGDVELKSGNHPTRWMADFTTKYGTVPEEITPEMVTPDMQRFASSGAIPSLGGLSDLAKLVAPGARKVRY